MDKRMEPLSVSTTNEGRIEIIQETSELDFEASIISLSPDQVDILIKWLTEAREELQQTKMN